ncbi:MAG TPA: hypothetical protein VJC07_02785 [Candidatus Nanoarchaeia archaeon]|nr:hypothetical protein [Candidatus Nanoarchaeia archaeon]
MSKKGLVHIDWAISMGIFVISIIALFTFLRPGIKEPGDENLFLNLIQDNFEKNVSTKIVQTPLIVEELDSAGVPDQPEININVVSGGWRATNAENLPEGFASPIIDGNDLTLKCRIGVCDTEMENEKHSPIMLTFHRSAHDAGELELDDDICSRETGCSAYLGVDETTEGLSQSLINSLFSQSTDYEAVKSEWGFPKNKDFSISEGDEISFGKDDAGERNVFVRQGKYWLLNEDGTRTKYAVIFKAW